MGIGEKALAGLMLQEDLKLGPGWRTDPAGLRGVKSVARHSFRRIRVAIVLLSTAVLPMAMRSQTVDSQSLATPATSDSAATSTVQIQPKFIYAPPTQRTRATNYLFDAFGPYPLLGSAFAAGLSQSSDAPPEWGEGAEGYGKRIGSDFAIAAIATTARYGMARALREDTLYYPCSCKGIFPRFKHAVFSTLTARAGPDGHRVFSVPALLAPYAGSFTGVYGWYPSRFGAKDAFRIGNYTLLGSVYGNIGLEFIYSGPHSLLSRLHLNDTHGAPVDDHDAPLVTHAAPANTPAAPLEGTKN
jgi:hypothetical protein